MSDKVYRIKPLVWLCVARNDYYAESPLGNIRVVQMAIGEWYWRCGDVQKFDCNSLEAAQLAAEQWHRERMAAGLVEVGA